MTTVMLQPLQRLRARARAGIAVEAAGALAVAGATFVVATLVLDRTLRLETGYRAALLAALVLVVVHLVRRRLVRPWRVPLSADEMALAVERNDPPLRQALISAVQFARTPASRASGDSRQLMERVVHDVSGRLDAIPFGAALDSRRTLRFGALVLAVAAGAAAWAGLDRGTFALWFKRNVLLAGVEWPRRTHLEFVEPVVRLPQGDDLTLRVAASGVVPEQVRLAYRFAGGERGTEAMTLTGEAEFRTTLTAMLEDVTVQAWGGDGETAELRIEVVQRPVITDLRLQVEPPAYAGAVEPASTNDTDLRLLRGSKLSLTARSDKALRDAFLLLGEADRVALTVDADGHTLRGTLVPTETMPVAVDVVDVDRLGAKSPPRFYVRLVEDQPPAIDLRLSGIGSMVTPIARIPADLTVRDDFGLVAVSAWHRITGKPTIVVAATPEPGMEPQDGPPQPEAPAAEPAEAEVEFTPVAAGLPPIESPTRELRTQAVVDLRDLATAKPGQMLALRFDARDNFGSADPHTTQGEPVVFRVVTAEELAADLQRRQLEQRKLLETVLSQQETARSQLAETIAPTADEPRAAQARQKLTQLAKTERDLGARCASIGQTYAQVLDEALNNRIAQAGDLRGLRDHVVEPLAALATAEFPQAASATEAHSATGHDDLKQVALATYDKIIGQIRSILAHMQEEERLAAVVAMLRDVIKLEAQVFDETTKRRGEVGSEVFGTGRDGKNQPPKDGGDKK